MNDWIREILCWHKWRCIGVFHYIDTSWDGEATSTQATFRCDRCGRIKGKSMYGSGHLSKDELNGEGK